MISVSRKLKFLQDEVVCMRTIVIICKVAVYKFIVPYLLPYSWDFKTNLQGFLF